MGPQTRQGYWSYTLSGEPDLLASRGFTSYEWLPWFNLYNMNGRLYDPVIWNSGFMRRNTGDAIFINTGLNLTYLGGGSDNAGIILPLRGPDAFSPHWINTASFRLGGQLGFDALTVGKAWYNGPVNEAYMSYISGYGNSIDFNAGVVFGFGPGGGLFAGYDENDIIWYGHYRSVGWGAGGSLGFDYTTVRPMFRKKRKS